MQATTLKANAFADICFSEIDLVGTGVRQIISEKEKTAPFIVQALVKTPGRAELWESLDAPVFP